MLYVFHVDAGLMTTYSMDMTLKTVSDFKLEIEKQTKIPANSIVLLISGGEVLQSDHRVSSYTAGTDSNPFYMFSKPSVKDGSLKQTNQYSVCDLSPIVELSTEHWRSETRSGVEVKSVGELKSAVEKCCSLPPAVQTVVTCATLAQQFRDYANDISKSCDQLVHDQHLQYQGWSAVVANLEDIFNEFCERSKNFKESFKKHRLKKDQYHEQLNALNDVLESLGKIPILPALRENAEEHRFSAFDVFEEPDFDGHYDRISAPLDNSSENKAYQDFGVEPFKMSEEDVFEPKPGSRSHNPSASSTEERQRIVDSDEGVFKAQSYDSNKEDLTLLKWILAQGNQASLQDILDYCQKGLKLIDADPLKVREAELCDILEYANNHGLKQIKGIEDRLYGLDQLLNDVKNLVKDQRDQAASLIQNRDRVATGCDPSVLPTLVQSHRCQLEKLLKNHQLLVDIRRRIAKSKEELSHILKARLEAVLMIENSMSVQDAHQMLSFQCFNRLARYFDIVEQLHHAPAIFVHAVHEVARRRMFSDAFIKWATELANKLLVIHDEEVSRRQEFNELFHGHFLKSLFPGTTDLPPTFATQSPAVFDGRLPKLTAEDVQFVETAFAELSADVPKYDMEETVKFFTKARFGVPDLLDKDVDVQLDLGKALQSEKDNSDFETISQQNSEKEKLTVDTSTTCVPETMAVSVVTEDNMDTHKINMDKLKSFLVQLLELCKCNIVLIRSELVKLKSEIDEQKQFITGKHLELLQIWHKNNEETAIKFREETQRLTVDHELELSDLKNELTVKDEAIDRLKNEKEELKKEYQKDIEKLEHEHQSTKQVLDKVREEINAFERKMEDAEALKQKEIKDMQEKLHSEYKAEIESLRSRFRLVALTNMDRSPSESSLEKIERTDVIEISNHNAIVLQTKENAEVEREEAVRLAVEACEKEWRNKMADAIATMKAVHDTEKQVTMNEVTRRLLSEKDRQLELLRERETNLIRECTKYKETIQQLTDPETNDYDALLKAQVATLTNEKLALQQQLQDLKKELEKKSEEGADKSKEDDSDGRRSPNRGEGCSRAGHTPVGLVAGTVSLSACLPGHVVLVLWDPAHHNYTLLQEAPIMYFVHSGCLEGIDLSINVKRESDRKLYTVAVVDSKEYCYAKKSGNRYHMPRGSRFYRVRVKPYKALPAPPPCCEHKHKTQDKLKRLTVLCEHRPVKKWLTYMHATDTQKSIDTSQSASSNMEEGKIGEVATATLINLESPASALPPSVPEDQLDSIETSDWATGKMQISAISTMTDMECSVGRVLGPDPLELPTEQTVTSQSVHSRTEVSDEPDSELAEEATP